MTAPVALTMLRAVAPDVPLTVGSILGARVLSREGDRGTLLLLGARLAAQLPEGVKEGDALRVRVQEASSDKLVLKVVETPDAPAAQTAAQLTTLPPIALPNGATARLFVEPDDEAGASRGSEDREGGTTSIFVRYDSPVLGRIDIALTLTGDAIGAALQLSAGEPARAARGGAPALQGALAAAAARPALVQVLARDETVDLRA